MVGAGQVKGGEQGFLVAMLSASGIWQQHSGMATFGEVEVYLDSTPMSKIIFLQPEMDIETSPHLLLFQGFLTPLNKWLLSL